MRKVRYYDLTGDAPKDREEKYEIWKSGGVYSNGTSPSNDEKAAIKAVRECRKLGRVPVLVLFYNYGTHVYSLPWY